MTLLVLSSHPPLKALLVFFCLPWLSCATFVFGLPPLFFLLPPTCYPRSSLTTLTLGTCWFSPATVSAPAAVLIPVSVSPPFVAAAPTPCSSAPACAAAAPPPPPPPPLNAIAEAIAAPPAPPATVCAAGAAERTGTVLRDCDESQAAPACELVVELEWESCGGAMWLGAALAVGLAVGRLRVVAVRGSGRCRVAQGGGGGGGSLEAACASCTDW
eukprot:1159740-Pelagomonas_calceolata.AAC.4